MSDQAAAPFYVVVDVSASMATELTSDDGVHGESPIISCNRIVRRVWDDLCDAPILGSTIRFSLLDFSDDTRVVLSMCDLMQTQPIDIPNLQVRRGGRSFTSAFDLLRRQLEIDVAQLEASGHRVFRPTLLFVVNGEPTDDETSWRASFAALTDSRFRERPNVLSLGIAEAKMSTLDQLVSPEGRSWSRVAEPGEDPAWWVMAWMDAEGIDGAITHID